MYKIYKLKKLKRKYKKYIYYCLYKHIFHYNKTYFTIYNYIKNKKKIFLLSTFLTNLYVYNYYNFYVLNILVSFYK
jgi:hypothetical protein